MNTSQRFTKAQLQRVTELVDLHYKNLSRSHNGEDLLKRTHTPYTRMLKIMSFVLASACAIDLDTGTALFKSRTPSRIVLDVQLYTDQTALKAYLDFYNSVFEKSGEDLEDPAYMMQLILTFAKVANMTVPPTNPAKYIRDWASELAAEVPVAVLIEAVGEDVRLRAVQPA